MHQGGLEHQIADGFAQQPQVTEHQVRLIDDLARVLKETADTAATVRQIQPIGQPLAQPFGHQVGNQVGQQRGQPVPPQWQPPRQPSGSRATPVYPPPSYASPGDAADHARPDAATGGMPQMLRSMAVRNGQPADDTWPLMTELRRAFKVLSPITLTLATGTLAIVAMFTVVRLLGFSDWSATEIVAQSATGLELQTLLPVPAATQPVFGFAAHSYPNGSYPPGGGIAVEPEFSSQDRALLRRSAGLITVGDVPAARTVLAQAASEGSTAAAFALAETFDPNMLAAWGSRDPLADVVLARRFYNQALTSGDARAGRRIQALAAE